MRHLTPLLLAIAALLLIPFAAGCEDEHAADKEAIRAALRQLDQANEDCDGAAAVAVMSTRGLEEYTRLVKLALDGSKSDVQSLSPFDMWEIVQLRHRLTRQQLEQMDGRAYQEHATSQCWYAGFDSDWEGSIGDIYVSGDTAYADVLDFEGRKTGVQGHFEREDGVWKVNEFSFQRGWDDELRTEAAAMGMTIPDYILFWEEMETGEKISSRIWEPMR